MYYKQRLFSAGFTQRITPFVGKIRPEEFFETGFSRKVTTKPDLPGSYKTAFSGKYFAIARGFYPIHTS